MTDVAPLRALIAALSEEGRRQAFTHASWEGPRTRSYERLEFLGDGVLGLVAAEELCRRHPGAGEGELARWRAHVVSRRSCAVVARLLDLGAELEREQRRRGAEDAGLGRNRNVLAALLEAAVGAVFLECGYARTAPAVVAAFEARLAYAAEGYVDHKTELQERAARLARSVTYELVRIEGPPHRRRFRTDVLVDGLRLGSGSGGSKKASEQGAARVALARLRAGAEDDACT